MGTIVELVNPRDTLGGLRDGHRRDQSGVPTSTLGQVPRYQGETHNPGSDVNAPKILSSAVRQNQGTNVAIPYARVVRADEASDKGRLDQGDVAFIARYGFTTGTQMRPAQFTHKRNATHYPHADISRLAGLDYINTKLDDWVLDHTVLVNSHSPHDEWRSLSFLNEWTVDGVVMSNDSPGYVLSSSRGARNDQLFNVAIQGPTQINNDFGDDGLAPHMRSTRSALKDGPFYNVDRLQKFDREIMPLADLYVGLTCSKMDRTAIDKNAHVRQKCAEHAAATSTTVDHLHTFKYILFSSRQAWQFTQNDTPMQKKRKLDIEFKEDDLKRMVGAWRLGKVIDVASQRKQRYSGGPIDTPFRVTLNVDISFLDWRALRRSLGVFSVANDFVPDVQWNKAIIQTGPYEGLYDGDDGRVMQWPTMYYLNEHDDPYYRDQNIPVYITNGDRTMEYESLELQIQRKEYSIEQTSLLRKEYSTEQTSLLNEFTELTNEIIFEGQVTRSKQRTIGTNIQRISDKIWVYCQRLSEVALQMTICLEMLSKEEGKGKEFTDLLTAARILRDTSLQIGLRISNMLSSTMSILEKENMAGHLIHQTNVFMTSFNRLRNIKLSAEHRAWHSSCMRLLTMLRGAAAFVNFYADAHYRVNTTRQLLIGNPLDLSGRYMDTKSIIRQRFALFKNELLYVYTSGKGDLHDALNKIAGKHLLAAVDDVNKYTDVLREEMMQTESDTHSDNLNQLLKEVDRQVQTVTSATNHLMNQLQKRTPDLSVFSSKLLSATGELYMTSVRFYTFPITIYEDAFVTTGWNIHEISLVVYETAYWIHMIVWDIASKNPTAFNSVASAKVAADQAAAEQVAAEQAAKDKATADQAAAWVAAAKAKVEAEAAAEKEAAASAKAEAEAAKKAAAEAKAKAKAKAATEQVAAEAVAAEQAAAPPPPGGPSTVDASIGAANPPSYPRRNRNRQ